MYKKTTTIRIDNSFSVTFPSLYDISFTNLSEGEAIIRLNNLSGFEGSENILENEKNLNPFLSCKSSKVISICCPHNHMYKRLTLILLEYHKKQKKHKQK